MGGSESGWWMCGLRDGGNNYRESIQSYLIHVLACLCVCAFVCYVE